MKKIKSVLRSNQVSRRLFFLKDLILSKLNLIISATQDSAQSAEQLSSEIQRTIGLSSESLNSIHHLSENQVFLLKSSIDTVNAVRHSLDTLQAVQNSIVNSEFALAELRDSISQIAEEARAELRDSIGQFAEETSSHNVVHKHLLDKIYDNVSGQKYKLVLDSSYFQAIDIELMVYLYSFLPCRTAIDVGANRGDVSSRLLQAGFEVYAFEPFPPVFNKLSERLASNPNFHSFPCALGSVDEVKDLHLAVDLTEDKIYDDPTYYSSLTRHSLSDGLVFSEVIPVSVKTLASLHQSGELPSHVGLVKIDTEGFDLEVIRGMGDLRYPVVVAEFWDPNFPFAQTGSMNCLKDMVPVMQQRGYSWYVIIYRIWGSSEISYYCNSAYSLDQSWGNIFFFRDHNVFSEALKWCSATMPATYFSV
jgi:FkbM family methyltransferase